MFIVIIISSQLQEAWGPCYQGCFCFCLFFFFVYYKVNVQELYFTRCTIKPENFVSARKEQFHQL